MKIDSIDESSSITVRVAYKLHLDCDLKEASDILVALASESAISGFLEKGNDSDVLFLTLDGTPLDIGKFIITLNSSFPSHVNITNLTILGKKELHEFEPYNFYSTFTGENHNESYNEDLKFTEQDKCFLEHCLLELLHGKAISLNKEEKHSDKLYFLYTGNGNKFREIISRAVKVTLFFRDMDSLFKFCKFSPDIVKSIITNGSANNIHILETLRENLSLSEFTGTDNLCAVIPETSILKWVLAGLNDSDNQLPILFAVSKN